MYLSCIKNILHYQVRCLSTSWIVLFLEFFSEDVHIETRPLYYWPCRGDVTSDGVEPQCHRLLSRRRSSSRLLADNNRFLFSRSLPFHLPFSSSERWSDPTVWWNRRVLLSLGDWPRGRSAEPVIAFLPVFWPGSGEMDSIPMRELRQCKPDSTTGWKKTFIKPPQDAWKLHLNCTDDDRTCYRSGNLHRSPVHADIHIVLQYTNYFSAANLQYLRDAYTWHVFYLTSLLHFIYCHQTQ